MKRLALVSLHATTVVGLHAETYVDNARVRSVDPQHESVSVPREVTTCRTVSDVQTRIAGYRVNYEYRGQPFTTLMRESPGQSLQVRVSVDPVGR